MANPIKIHDLGVKNPVFGNTQFDPFEIVWLEESFLQEDNLVRYQSVSQFNDVKLAAMETNQKLPFWHVKKQYLLFIFVLLNIFVSWKFNNYSQPPKNSQLLSA